MCFVVREYEGLKRVHPGEPMEAKVLFKALEFYDGPKGSLYALKGYSIVGVATWQTVQ